jgi:hypothetical protein
MRMHIAAIPFACMNSSWTMQVGSAAAGINRTITQNYQVVNLYSQINSTLYNASVAYRLLTISNVQLINVLNRFGWPPLTNTSLLAAYGITTFNVRVIK